MVPTRDPWAPDAAELAGDDDLAFELEELAARAELRRPRWLRDGLAAGRLIFGKGPRARRVTRRLALRHAYPTGQQVVLRDTTTGLVVRLPFA